MTSGDATSLGAAVARLPDAEQIRAEVDAVLGEALYWFPVRHHSPVVAHHLERAIRERKPEVLFLEAPADLQDLLPHIADARTRPPVALYGSFKPTATEEDPEPRGRASWYPLVSYSPEAVAMRTASKLGVEVVFMDLPHDRRFGDPPDDAPTAKEGDESALDPEAARLVASRFYVEMAKAAGYKHWNEAWDTLFESSYDVPVEAFRRELATFCAASRATSAPKDIYGDDTLPRERFMSATIRARLDAGLAADRAMVVCGGFHLFMDRADPTPPPAAQQGELQRAVVPYSYRRIWEGTGYGAGNRAPRYYAHVWEGTRRKTPLSDLMSEFAVDVLRRARAKGERLSAADAVAVAHHGRLLAQLRGRSEPVLDDVRDALLSCCVKGDPAFEGQTLANAIKDAEIGTQVGRVTPGAGRLPIASDYYREIDRLELAALVEQDRSADLRLDQREPRDAERSAFLHRLRYLNVPVGDAVDRANPFGQAIFRERWRLGWKPEIEEALVAASLDGDTVKSASLRRLSQRLMENQTSAEATAAELVTTVRMDLSEMVEHAEQACGAAIDADSRFLSLAAALNHLLVLEGYATYRRLERTALTGLIGRAFARACFAVPEIALAPDEDHPAIMGALSSLAESVLQRDDLNADLFATHVDAAFQASTVPALQGAFIGILVEMRQAPVERLRAALDGYARGSADRQVEVGDFLVGVLTVSKTAVMQGARSIVEALDQILRQVRHEGFMAMAPRLRAAFEQLHARQRDAFAEEVARFHGLADSELTDTRLDVSADAAALIAEIDAEVAEVMAEWRLI